MSLFRFIEPSLSFNFIISREKVTSMQIYLLEWIMCGINTYVNIIVSSNWKNALSFFLSGSLARHEL